MSADMKIELEGVTWCGTKAETLELLRYNGFPVPILLYFTISEWRIDPGAIINKIVALPLAKDAKLAIRSSAKNEDGTLYSQAGVYESVLNVSIRDHDELEAVIEKMAEQFTDPGDQIIVQDMVGGATMSGVATTHVLSDGSPYYVINYDDVSGRTDTVTGGHGSVKTVYVYRGARKSDFDSPRLRAVMDLMERLEAFFGEVPLDTEFVVDENLIVHLLQVRPLCSKRHWREEHEQAVSSHIPYVALFVDDSMSPRMGLYGRTTIFGVMPDWNPAEMISISPRPLAFSLYREAITRRVWSLARERMGYRKLPPVELMLSLSGRPYIDVRASFNSFLPDALPETMAENLVNAWIERLDTHPNLHDKVEFGIVHTMAEFGVRDSISERYPGLLSAHELDQYVGSLQRLTNTAMKKDGTLHMAKERIEALRVLQEKTLHVERKAAIGMTPPDIALRIADAIENCRALGTLPFSIIARHAFIAEALLQSAVRMGVLTQERVAEFKISIQTISGKLAADFHAVVSGALSHSQFLSEYGHLRPGTYDILSPSYNDRPDLFDASSKSSLKPQSRQPFALTHAEVTALNSILRSESFDIDAPRLLEYASKAIAGREYAKFVFTRHISHILELLTVWGAKMSLSRTEVSMLSINEVLETLHKPYTVETVEYFTARIRHSKSEYERGCSFVLPYLIRSERDIYIVPQHRSAPNFITRKQLTAPVCVLDNRTAMNEDLHGKIVCIDSADPGYDWIFTRGIAGLITCYGGVNSHMAIRCAEYDLPAAIGCGELIFAKMQKAAACILDCGVKKVTPLLNGTAEERM